MTQRHSMDPVDQLLLRQESDRRRRSTITLVVQLDRMPDWDGFVSRLASTVRHEPRLRQRVVRPWRDLGAPEWVVEPDIDVRDHLSRHTLPEPGTMEELVAFVERIAGEDIDHTRPLWHVTVLNGGVGGSAALVARMSHVLTDGLAGMQLLAGLVDLGDEPVLQTDTARPASAQAPSARLTSGRLTAERLRAAPFKAQRRYWRNYAIGVRTTGALLSHPRRRVGEGVAYIRSLARIVAPRTSAPSFAARSGRRRLTFLEVPADDLRRAGRSVGGTLNDAYLAAVTGGIRRYHESNGSHPQLVPFAIPVSTRKRGEHADSSEPGNRFAGVRFAAPVGIADPAARTRMVNEIVRSAKAEPALDALTTLAPALVQLPDRVLALAGRAQDRLDMQASYVPGPPIPVGLAGAGVTSMWAFGPLPGPAAMSVLLTYAGVARIGFTVDAAAVPDVDAFRQAMIDGFAEVIALGAAADSSCGATAHG